MTGLPTLPYIPYLPKVEAAEQSFPLTSSPQLETPEEKKRLVAVQSSVLKRRNWSILLVGRLGMALH